MESRTDDVLVALRQIMRATDLHSKNLKKRTGLTTPQLVVLLALEHGELTIGTIAERVSLSVATVTAILDRLERQVLISRRRSDQDRRRVYAFLTPIGKDRLKNAPPALQYEFVDAFNALDDWEQSYITAAFQRVAQMMNAEAIEASPLLAVQPIAESATSGEGEPSSTDRAEKA